MRITKAVITAAGRGVRLYPAADTVQKGMLPFIDRDGLNKPLLQIIAEEALDSGIEEICVVGAPGDEKRYRESFAALRANLVETYEGVEWAVRQVERLDNLLRRLTFATQEKPCGYGDSVYCAREFVGGDPFLLLLGDHLYISRDETRRCAQQLLDLATAEKAPAAAVHATREHLIGRYGTVAGRRVGDHTGVYQIETIVEKPSLSLAELQLQVPGLRVGHYLCFFGMHVLTPTIFDLLGEAVEANKGECGNVLLTPALQELARREKYLALEVRGTRHDIGASYGILQTQLAMALDGEDRDSVLALIAEQLAQAAR